MLDRVRIVDMATERNRGGPVVAVAPPDGTGVDLAERSRVGAGDGDEIRFGWSRVVVGSLMAIGLMWLVSVI